mmetsp:Transcript_5854/g.12911  ORF Transcript_5854/g.12911 Transcript_5854/m.12911 type:complete len:313 (+) Transcript_5854:38-976(+)
MMTLLRCVLLALFLAATVELGAAWRPRSTVATSPLESAYASEKRAHARNRRRALFTSAHSDGADKQRKAVIVSAAGAASADTPSPRVSSPFWKGMMMGICLIWASNFAVIKRSFVGIPASVLTPQLFLAIRFTLASLATLPLLIGSNLSWGMVRNGILVGLSIFLSLVASTLTTPTEHSHEGSQDIMRKLQEAPFRNGSERYYDSVWKKLELVDGLRNEEVLMVVTSTSAKDEKLLRERVIASSRTWMRGFANVVVVIEVSISALPCASASLSTHRSSPPSNARTSPFTCSPAPVPTSTTALPAPAAKWMLR